MPTAQMRWSTASSVGRPCAAASRTGAASRRMAAAAARERGFSMDMGRLGKCGVPVPPRHTGRCANRCRLNYTSTTTRMTPPEADRIVMDASGPTTPPVPAAPPRLSLLLAAELRAARTDVVRRWLDRIVARVPIEPERACSRREELLNHVPLLVDGIADYLETDGERRRADGPVDGQGDGARRAAPCAGLRRVRDPQGARDPRRRSSSPSSARRSRRVDPPTRRPPTWRCVLAARRRRRSEQIRQATMTHFLRVSAEQVRQREERLRRFNRMVSHELKNRIGAIRGASSLLAEPWLEPDAARAVPRRSSRENAEGLQRVLENLTALSRLDGDARQQRQRAAAAGGGRGGAPAARCGGARPRGRADRPTSCRPWRWTRRRWSCA